MIKGEARERKQGGEGQRQGKGMGGIIKSTLNGTFTLSRECDNCKIKKGLWSQFCAVVLDVSEELSAAEKVLNNYVIILTWSYKYDYTSHLIKYSSEWCFIIVFTFVAITVTDCFLEPAMNES